MTIVIILLSLSLVGLIVWNFILRDNKNHPKKNQNSQPTLSDDEIIKLNQKKSQLKAEILSLEEWQSQEIDKLTTLQQQVGSIKNEIKNFAVQEEDKLNALQDLNNQIALLSADFSAHQTLVESKKQELQEINDKISESQLLISSINECLSNSQAVAHDAIIRSRKLEYGTGITLNLDEREKFEIAKLEEVIPLLVNPLALNKAIYEIYFRAKIKKLNELQTTCGRSGVYRIYVNIPTSSFASGKDEVLSDGENSAAKDAPAYVTHCYVGQAVDIADRWTTHLKRLVGAEEGTKVVFYKEAKKYLFDLKWEVLEFCDKSKLNEREHYWIEFYGGISDWNMRG